MLKIFYGRDYEEYNGLKVISKTSPYFKYNMRRDWFNDPFVKDMILDVDKSTVIGDWLIDSPILGLIPPERLSGGVKALILMYFLDDIIVNGSSCGDNCLKWILEIGKKKDIIVNFRHYFTFKEEPFEVEILGTGIIAKNNKELYKGISLSDSIWQEYHEKKFGKGVYWREEEYKNSEL